MNNTADYTIGDIITMGFYSFGSDGTHAPIEWYVIVKEEYLFLLLTKHIIDFNYYVEHEKRTQWLEKLRDTAFSDNEKRRMIQDSDSTELFYLSVDDFRMYCAGSEFSCADPTEYARIVFQNPVRKADNEWWLESPRDYAFVDETGKESRCIIAEGKTGIRLALWIKTGD